jgi:CheY-like chemotaxis protein
MNEEKVDVVIVEDDPNDAELIVRVFRKHNMVNRIVLLKDGAEALSFFFGSGADEYPKIVLLDLKLPKVNGIEVLQRLKADERTKDIPVVVLTSSAENQDLRDAYRYGANSYVTKPIRFEEFANAVSELRLYWLLLNRPLEGQAAAGAGRGNGPR